MPTIGQTFAGYELEEQVGEGGIGLVYKARDVRLQRPVALRVVAPDIAKDAVTRARLNRESTVLASVDHPNVAPIFDAGECDGQIYIASRWVDGISLKDLVRQQGPLSPRRAVRIVDQVAWALQAAHSREIMHRNVRPSSVLVTASDHVYLTDFGLARRADDMTGLTVQDQLLESFNYVAPEYIGGGKVDLRVDIYGLGCILFEALTGELPYPMPSAAAKMYAHLQSPPPSARERRPEVPPHLDSVVQRAMAKDPDERQQSAAEFAIDASSAVELSAPPWASVPRPAPAAAVSPPLPAAPAPAPAAPAAGPEARAAGPEARAAGPEARAGSSDLDEGAPAPIADDDGTAPEADDYYEPVYFLNRRRSRPPVIGWALALLVFLAAPIALLIALLH